jgi:hypothetical protein
MPILDEAGKSGKRVANKEDHRVAILEEALRFIFSLSAFVEGLLRTFGYGW